jgi:hypothetical protein
MFEYFEQTTWWESQGRRLDSKPESLYIVAFFAAVPGNSRSKTVYMTFGLKFAFTKILQLLVLSNEMRKNIDISIYKTLLQLVLPSLQTPHTDILK